MGGGRKGEEAEIWCGGEGVRRKVERLGRRGEECERRDEG